jgi:hypothetical protein
MSVEILLRHVLSERLVSDRDEPVSLLNMDASDIGSFEVQNSNKSVLVYCWDRGLGSANHARLANVALQSPSVRGSFAISFLIFNVIGSSFSNRFYLRETYGSESLGAGRSPYPGRGR